jgi:hypothetical protein
MPANVAYLCLHGLDRTNLEPHCQVRCSHLLRLVCHFVKSRVNNYKFVKNSVGNQGLQGIKFHWICIMPNFRCIQGQYS